MVFRGNGALDGGRRKVCHLSILRNGNVACFCRLFMSMWHVRFKKGQCCMSFSIICCMSLSLMLAVVCGALSVNYEKGLYFVSKHMQHSSTSTNVTP